MNSATSGQVLTLFGLYAINLNVVSLLNRAINDSDIFEELPVGDLSSLSSIYVLMVQR
jgi:hypothetical protein